MSVGSNVDSQAEAVVAIVKEVGEILSNVPYLKVLSEMILQIARIREEFDTELHRLVIERALGMSKSVYEMLAEVSRSNRPENFEKLESHLHQFERALNALYFILKKHRSQPRMSRLLNKNRNIEELQECNRRLQELNTEFILDIVVHFTTEQALTGDRLEALPVSRTSPSAPDSILPPIPYFMVGRQDELDMSLNILLRDQTSRIAILGGVGFGKTTLALSILHDVKIANRYKSRYFLSCDGMVDVKTWLTEFATMLSIKATPSAVLASAQHILTTSTTLLCLDNFETLWGPSITRITVEEILSIIADIPNLSLVITMRGTQRPSKVAWSHPLLPPLSTLSANNALLVLKKICPDHIVDNFTQQLLDGVEGIPLAITLIANLLHDGETSQSLWTRWSNIHTDIIEDGGNGQQSGLNVSPTLSVPGTTIHGNYLISRGIQYGSEGLDTQAMESFRDAANLFKQEKNFEGEALALEHLGDILTDMGRLDQAEIAFKESLELYGHGYGTYIM